MPAVRPKVGVGVFVTTPSRPRHVLLGERLGSHGANTFALPGGHLEFGESWHDCAAREVLEETGLVLRTPRCATVLNVVERATDYHYVVIFMAAECVDVHPQPLNLEPEKCAGWGWYSWDEKLPTPLFGPLALAREQGFDPFEMCGTLLEPSEPLPPYVCVILHEEATGQLLLEQRPDDAAKAAGQLTCFGGTREDGEGAAACAVRECAEELGWAPPAASLRRAVDLYVDGALIAWFYEAAAPARDAPLRFEEGRSGVWLDVHSAIDHPKLSSWHECVLRAWRRAVPAGLGGSTGVVRADFTTPPDWKP